MRYKIYLDKRFVCCEGTAVLNITGRGYHEIYFMADFRMF